MELTKTLRALLVVMFAAVAGKGAVAQDACAASRPIPGLKSAAGVASDRATAEAIARAVALAAFGAESLRMREPLRAFEAETSWSIVGTLPEHLQGGDLVIRLCKVDGRVFHLEVGK